MKYRKFEVADMDVSLLGFGVMRMPLLKDGSSKLDEKESIRMIRYAIDHGVNYIDTAYVYHEKQSESLVGKALANGYRERVLLATKMSFWAMEGPDEIEPIFNEQLANLRTDYVDMYLLHDVRGSNWETVKEWKALEFMVKQRDADRIRFLGFSFHGESTDEFKMILDEFPWDFCQLQINFMDKDIQAGVKGFEYAISKGVPIIVMEPLKGGKLTETMPPTVKEYWSKLGSDRTPAEWALRWVANLPGILTILSGMNTIEQVEENIRVLSDADMGMLSYRELDIIEKAAEEYRKLTAYPCTACGYCMPCPSGIHIPIVLNHRNSCNHYGKSPDLQFEFNVFVSVKPSACIACGKCEKACPQHLNIIQAMRETAELFE